MGLRRGCGARALGAIAAIAFCVTLAAYKARGAESAPDPLPLFCKSIPLSSANSRETRVGSLLYRGGIEITSSDRRFGGWSGLLVSADGTHLLSQSDEGHWLRASVLYDKRANLAGLANGHLADLKGLDGKALDSKLEADAEGLAALTDKGPDGPVAVSFERDARIWRYDIGSSLEASPTQIPAPDAIATLDFNSGLEGLARFSPDLLLAVAETPQIRGGDHSAWLIPIAGHKLAGAGALSIQHHAPYEISDAAMSPDGRWLYLLERHYFGLLGGVVVGVRRVPASAVKVGANLDGEEIARFTMHENIDNMEGMALRRDAAGKTLLYMISDDNYNQVLQRTVLLMFEVSG